MKKIAMALSLVLFPLTAQAQSGGDQVIQAAADELKPAFCANNLKQAIQIVEGCYAKVDEDSEKYNMNQCVIEDIFVVGIMAVKRKQYVDNFQTDPYANLDFDDNTNAASRWLKHPSFISNIITNVEKMKQLGYRVGEGVGGNLKQENCLDFENLK
ncbi:hypothetical protein [Commensalibacter communis]|uniref:hypothetical protein n=1 Tax=Commensalibacter communis TaxID=2972786 RepID=UPI00232B7450|nr:hypothetical protein [Commensalibacter communis]